MVFWSELVSIGESLFSVLRNIYDTLTVPMSQLWGNASFIYDILSSVVGIFGINIANMSILGFVLSVVIPTLVYFHIFKFFKDLIF